MHSSGASRREIANVHLKIECRHCEPTGRANARPMTGSAKQSTLPFLLLPDLELLQRASHLSDEPGGTEN
jgi:hypothetical protein